MKKSFFVLTLMFLLTAGLCFAQDASSAAQPATQQPAASQDAQQPSMSPDAQQPATDAGAQQPQTNVGQPTDADQPVFKGCVSGKENNYFLTDEKGEKFRLHSDKDINEHVGDMVEVRGTIKKEGADRAAVSTNSEREIDVADVKTVSKGCSASAK
ncbi:MAG TPA: DUF5818 domain-containing protein [Terriglobales bacterium]|nr:DUF5818 domain-containing protein [Terriglobales bacterium]